MSYQIDYIDITKPEVELELRKLFMTAFNRPDMLPEGYIYNNVFTKLASSQSFFLAAIEDGKILGCMGFMSTDFYYNQKQFNCYQCVWAATWPEHQGKKIFVNIVNSAKEILKEQGAGFMYCLAGDNTDPIFIKKLGFKSIPAVSNRIPNIPLLKDLWFKKPIHDNISYYRSNTFTPVEEQIADLKRNTDSRDFERVDDGKSFAWGKVRSRNIKGVVLKYFYLGGISLEHPSHYKKLCAAIFNKYKVAYIQIISSETNRYNGLVQYWRPAKINGFLFFELNSGPIHDVNVLYGIIDVF